MITKPRILFLTLTNDVGSDRLVSDFGRHGAVCAVLGPEGCFASLSRFVTERFALQGRLGTWASTFGFAQRFAAVVTAWAPDRIVPLDELAALLVRSVGTAKSTAPDIRRLVVRSLGRTYGYHAACHRVPLMALASGLGVRIPEFSEATTADRQVGFPVVVKRDHSSGSGGVAIAHDTAGLAATLRQFRTRQAAKRVLARAAGHGHGPGPILLQAHVDGVLAMRTVACQDGRVLDGINFTAVQIHPAKRASTMLQMRHNPEMDATAQAMVAALGCSGFVSFDFIVDRDDRAFMIEMNPRPIGSTHLGRSFGHDLCGALLAGGPITEAVALADEQIVALFPKELERDPASSCLDRASGLIHDVPSDEPAIVEAYLTHLEAIHPAWSADLRRQLGPARVETSTSHWPLAGLAIR